MTLAQKSIKEFLLAIALGLSVGFSGVFLPTLWAVVVQFIFICGACAYATWLIFRLQQATRKSIEILNELRKKENADIKDAP